MLSTTNDIMGESGSKVGLVLAFSVTDKERGLGLGSAHNETHFHCLHDVHLRINSRADPGVVPGCLGTTLTFTYFTLYGDTSSLSTAGADPGFFKYGGY